MQNIEAVAQAEQAEGLEKYRMEVASILATARLPFRSFTDPSLGLLFFSGIWGLQNGGQGRMWPIQ